MWTLLIAAWELYWLDVESINFPARSSTILLNFNIPSCWNGRKGNFFLSFSLKNSITIFSSFANATSFWCNECLASFQSLFPGLHLCKKRINHCVDINLIFQLHVATSSWARFRFLSRSSCRHMTINFFPAIVCFSAPLSYPSTLLSRLSAPNAKCNHEIFCFAILFTLNEGKFSPRLLLALQIQLRHIVSGL